MTNFRHLAAAMALLCAVPAASLFPARPKKAPDSLPSTSINQTEDALIMKAREFLTNLEKGDFEAAAKDFDETMLKVSGPEKLAEFWTQVPSRLGTFKEQTAARRDKLGPYEIALVTCVFEKVTLDARIVFDQERRIAGFQFVPSVPPASYEPPSYADPERFGERDVTFGSEGWELPGTLSLPKGSGPFPALVLVHGSGPNDRDETIGPNKPFRDLAWGLATRGIAVLRYEKRTKVYGAKMVADKSLGAAFTVKEETIDDALEAVRLLKREAGIDPSKIYVLGHSLGGYLAPRIAAAGKDLEIAGFVILAGLTRPLEDTIINQMTYLFGIDGALSEEDGKQLDSLREQASRIKTLTEADLGSGEDLMNAGPAYWLDLRGYDPPESARAVSRPMLILQGSRDYQVKVEDFENWKKALGERDDVEFHLYPRLNHLFFGGQGLITPNEYVQRHGSVDVEVIGDIASWILRH